MKSVYVVMFACQKREGIVQPSRTVAICPSREDAFKLKMQANKLHMSSRSKIRIRQVVLNTLYPLGVQQNDLVAIPKVVKENP